MPTFRATFTSADSSSQPPREETFEAMDMASAKFAAERLERPDEALERVEAVVGV